VSQDDGYQYTEDTKQDRRLQYNSSNITILDDHQWSFDSTSVEGKGTVIGNSGVFEPELVDSFSVIVTPIIPATTANDRKSWTRYPS